MGPQPPLRSTHATFSPRSRLVYDRWGAYGRPVLFLHSLTYDRTMWWPVAAELAMISSCTIVAPDLPGHGQSPRQDDHDPLQLAGQLAVLVEGLGLRRAPIVISHGASARVAVAFAANYVTQHLLVLDPPPADAATVDDLVSTTGVDAVPEHYREYLITPNTDRALLDTYKSWLASFSDGQAVGSDWQAADGEPFLPLRDPHGLALQLRDLL